MLFRSSGTYVSFGLNWTLAQYIFNIAGIVVFVLDLIKDSPLISSPQTILMIVGAINIIIRVVASDTQANLGK